MNSNTKATPELQWGLIAALAALGLIRPLMGSLGVYPTFPGLATPFLINVLVAALWVGVTVARRVPNPVATLTLVGGLHAILVILLQQLISNLASSNPLPPVAYLSILLTNLFWGRCWGSWRRSSPPEARPREAQKVSPSSAIPPFPLGPGAPPCPVRLRATPGRESPHPEVSGGAAPAIETPFYF